MILCMLIPPQWPCFCAMKRIFDYPSLLVLRAKSHDKTDSCEYAVAAQIRNYDVTHLRGLALLIALSPIPAYADGLGGLSALRGLAYFAVGIFVSIWVVVWLVLRVTAKARQTTAEQAPVEQVPTRRPYWLKDSSIPGGLRLLALVQYVLAFIYSLVGFFRLIFPSHFQNRRVADWVIHSILFSVIFSVLAILSANGYSKRSPKQGFKLGAALGWFCVANACLYLVWHGWYPGFDIVAPVFGVMLLALLNWRYRPYFGVEQRSRSYLKLRSIVRWTGLVLGSLVFIFLASSLLVTSVFPQDEKKARAVLTGVADAMKEYRVQHGDWPASLDQLDSSVDLTYRWNTVEYLPESNELWLDVRIPNDPNLVYRLSFGRLSFAEEIGGLGHRLK